MIKWAHAHWSAFCCQSDVAKFRRDAFLWRVLLSQSTFCLILLLASAFLPWLLSSAFVLALCQICMWSFQAFICMIKSVSFLRLASALFTESICFLHTCICTVHWGVHFFEYLHLYCSLRASLSCIPVSALFTESTPLLRTRLTRLPTFPIQTLLALLLFHYLHQNGSYTCSHCCTLTAPVCILSCNQSFVHSVIPLLNQLVIPAVVRSLVCLFGHACMPPRWGIYSAESILTIIIIIIVIMTI